jgi:hypothetical protein
MFQDATGRVHSMPASWTDRAATDPFVAMAVGRALFRPADLLSVVAFLRGMER